MLNTHVKLADLQARGCIVYQAETFPIAIFHSEGKLHAVDNRCPHMGFPLERGTLKDGILTCFWHYARFDMASGGALDLFADDVRAFAVETRDGEVWLDLTPLAPEEQRRRVLRRLSHGLERDLGLVIAKAVIALTKDVRATANGDASHGERQSARVAFATGLEFGAHNRRDGWAMGQTIHVAMMNLLPYLGEEDGARALYHGLSAVARDCDGAPARHLIEPLPGGSPAFSTLQNWFRRFVEVRDEEGAERVLVTAAQRGATPAQMTVLLFSAATDHRFIQIGHTADFANKAIEAWQQSGAWQTADRLPLHVPLLASLAPSFVNASRAEESNSWRNPIDLVALLEEAFEQLPSALSAGQSRDNGPDVQPAGASSSPSARAFARGSGEAAAAEGIDLRTAVPAAGDRGPADQVIALANTLLSDFPADSIAAMLDALRHGMGMERLAAVVCYAAALRMARFHTANEFGDWDTVLHTFTFANAMHQAVRRAPCIALLRGVFDAAMSVYLDRFLNIPPARMPQSAPNSMPPESLLGELLALFDTQKQVNEAAALGAQYLANGGKPERLMGVLGKALLREDPDFHTIQTVEAAFAQFRLWRGTPQAGHFLIAALRYVAAHAPTSRAMDQTFRIAWRLHRGDRLFAEE
jgi:nitrite reductase/ring-hydroxylating ferredoxin subunit